MESPQRKVKRVRRSRAEINRLLEAFERSGTTQQAFCRGHGLSVATFSYWRRKATSARAADDAASTGPTAEATSARAADDGASTGPTAEAASARATAGGTASAVPAAGPDALLRPVRVSEAAAAQGVVVRLADATEVFFPAGVAPTDIAAVVGALQQGARC